MKSNHLHSLRPLRSPILRNTPFPPRKLATITTTSGSRKNRIFTPYVLRTYLSIRAPHCLRLALFSLLKFQSSRIRSRDEFSTLLLLSASSRQALITLWSTSFCASCRIVAPLVHDAIEKERVGETEGGVGFAVVEMDAPALGGLGGLGGEYFVRFCNIIRVQWNTALTLKQIDQFDPNTPILQ